MIRSSVVLVYDRPQSKFLLLKRTKEDRWMPEKWGLPGGKVEKDESYLNGAIRETFEETGLAVKELLHQHTLFTTNLIVNYYITDLYSGNIVLSPSEHDEYKWFSLPEIKELGDTTTPDLFSIIEKLLKGF